MSKPDISKIAVALTLAAAGFLVIAGSTRAQSTGQTDANQNSEAIQQHEAAKVKHQERALEAHGGKRAQHSMEAVGHAEHVERLKKGEQVPTPEPEQ